MNLTTNFSLAEMIRSAKAAELGIDNSPPPAVLTELQKTAEMMEIVRTLLGGRPIVITSGYRSPSLNARLPGASLTSAHMWGGAADFQCPAYGTPREICCELQHYAASLRFDQLIWEHAAWVHIGRAREPGKERHQLRIIDAKGDRLVERFV